MTDARRGLPSVTSLLESEGIQTLLEHVPRGVVVDAIRRTIASVRSSHAEAPADAEGWTAAVANAVDDATRRSLRRVINATGVVLHTNLGRAPLAAAALDAIDRVARGFSNLEYDVAGGQRGSRYSHCASLLRELTGAEDALVVNNCAAALVLALNTLADGRTAVVSRGELIEIGGSFRIPEIMERSGARLVEVGTTNRTHLADYRRALEADGAIILKVHRSNFEQSGFVSEVSANQLAALGAEHGVPVLYDLGSGLLTSLEAYGLAGEPTARDAMKTGASIVTMSGDKLLGGPQAGLLLGTRRIIDRIRANPLTRSYRVDKLTLAALEATLALYREPARAIREIPALAQLTVDAATLKQRADRLVAAIGDPRVSVVETVSSVGGGAFPTATILSAALRVNAPAENVERRLRGRDPAIVARISDGMVILDLRTVFVTDEEELVRAVRAALEAASA
jgi:L-seryl-tRNA(Ser) seleniumtransferase